MTTYTAAPAAALFLAAPTGGSDKLVATLAASVPSGGLQVEERIGGTVPKLNPDTGAALPLVTCPFAAVVLARGTPEEIIPRLREMVIRAAASIDTTASALLIGTEYAVKPGEGAVLVTMLVRRRPEFTPAAFRDRWLGEHAPFGLRIPVSGYRQLHADLITVAGLPAADRFDGAGTVLFNDLDHARTARATPEVAHDAARDEMQFVDHSRSMLAMFRLIV